MKVITSYPIIVRGKVVGNKNAADTLNWSNLPGSAIGRAIEQGSKAQTSVQQRAAKTGRLKNIVSKAREAGLGDAAFKTISALRNRNEMPVKEEIVAVPVQTGMSTNTKIAIGVALVAVLGVTIYAVTKK
jgi:hypothetical protein